MRKLSLQRALAAAALLLVPAPSGLAQRSDLQVLFVGHDPASPQYPFADMGHERSEELYSERTALFEAFLGEHFANLRVVYGADYEVAMSEEADVTIFDSRPKALPAENGEPEESRRDRLYLPLDFDRPALMIAENSPLIGEPLGSKLDWL